MPAAAAHMSPLCPGCKQLFHRSSIYTHDETVEMTIYLDHLTLHFVTTVTSSVVKLTSFATILIVHSSPKSGFYFLS